MLKLATSARQQRLWTFQPAPDVIIDPVVIPPLHWIYLDAVYLHREVKMVPSRQACGPALSHLLTTVHHLAFLDGDLAQVSVDGLQSEPVIDNNTVAVDPQRRRPNHFTVVR